MKAPIDIPVVLERETGAAATLSRSGRRNAAVAETASGKSHLLVVARRNRRALWDKLLPVTGPVLLVGLWWVAAATGLLNTKLVPAPGPTLATTWTALLHGTMAHDLLRTLTRVVYAFAFAAGIGVPLGILIGAKERIYRSIEFLIDFFRSTPSTAMFPLFMLIFGLGEEGKIALAAFAAFLIIVFNVAYGVLNARKTRILAARSMGASSLRIFSDVIFLETLPQIFVGLRAGVCIALVVVVVAEMFIGGVDGIGHRIIEDQYGYNLRDMYGSLFLSGAFGYGLNYLFLLVERHFVHWAGK
ncbi:MAG TPA: ABC transporter permease [Burkholderiales bacterium]|nr:ABC transporter permease [Burkholderiales bacterium]